MAPGDSLYFAPNLPHGVESLTDRAVYLAVFTQPPGDLTTVPPS